MGDYRDSQGALVERRRQLAERVAVIDEAADPDAIAQLSDKQRQELETLRQTLVPADDSVAALVAAEDAADRYHAWLHEAVDLASAIDAHTKPLVPSWQVLAKWSIYVVVGLLVIPALVLALLDALP